MIGLINIGVHDLAILEKNAMPRIPFRQWIVGICLLGLVFCGLCIVFLVKIDIAKDQNRTFLNSKLGHALLQDIISNKGNALDANVFHFSQKAKNLIDEHGIYYVSYTIMDDSVILIFVNKHPGNWLSAWPSIFHMTYSISEGRSFSIYGSTYTEGSKHILMSRMYWYPPIMDRPDKDNAASSLLETVKQVDKIR